MGLSLARNGVGIKKKKKKMADIASENAFSHPFSTALNTQLQLTNSYIGQLQPSEGSPEGKKIKNKDLRVYLTNIRDLLSTIQATESLLTSLSSSVASAADALSNINNTVNTTCDTVNQLQKDHQLTKAAVEKIPAATRTYAQAVKSATTPSIVRTIASDTPAATPAMLAEARHITIRLQPKPAADTQEPSGILFAQNRSRDQLATTTATTATTPATEPAKTPKTPAPRGLEAERKATELTNKVNTTLTRCADLRHLRIGSCWILPSGDIRVSCKTAADAELLKLKQDLWLRCLGAEAYILVPTYPILVTGVPVNSFLPGKEKELQPRTIEDFRQENTQLLADKVAIQSVSWLVKPAEEKKFSTLVLHFTSPIDANRVLRHGSLFWQNRERSVRRFIRNCSIVQCFRCQQYGHKSPQCRQDPRCGKCAKDHSTAACPGSQPNQTPLELRCVLCDKRHSSHSNSCAVRQQQKKKIEKILLEASKYWPEPEAQPAVTPGPSETSTRESSSVAETTQPTSTPAAVQVRTRSQVKPKASATPNIYEDPKEQQSIPAPAAKTAKTAKPKIMTRTPLGTSAGNSNNTSQERQTASSDEDDFQIVGTKRRRVHNTTKRRVIESSDSSQLSKLSTRSTRSAGKQPTNELNSYEHLSGRS